MARYTIRQQQGTDMVIMGTYPVSTDQAACDACLDEGSALDLMAKDLGHENFAGMCQKTGLTRDQHRVEKVA